MPTPDALPSPGDRALAAAADALARRLMERLPGGRAITRSDIAALPTAVAQPLLARLDARIDREAPAPASPWVDADAARAGARQWRDAARLAARVPAPEWPVFLGDACRLVVSHLVRPAETLAAVAFEDDGDAERPTALVMRRLGAFAPYPYLPEIAGQYVERKGIARIDRAALESLLRRIDRRMVAAFSADEWAGLLEPLFTLLGAPAGVPAELLQVLFEARGRDDLGRLFSGPVTPAALYTGLLRALPPPAEALPAEALPTEAFPEPVTPVEPLEEREPSPAAIPAEADVEDRRQSIHPPDERIFEPTVSPHRREADAAEEGLPGEMEDTAETEALLSETEEAARHPAHGADEGNVPAETLESTHEVQDAQEPAGLRGGAAETDWRTRDPDLSDWLRSASSAPPSPPSEPPAEPLPAEPLPAAEPPALRPPWFSNALATYDDPDDEQALTAPFSAPGAAAPDDGEPLWKRMMAPGAADPAAAAAAAPEPLWKRFVPHAAAPPDADLPRPPVAPPRPRLPGPAASAEPAQPELARLETRALGGAPDSARRAGFVAELFDGSEAEYAATLTRLADAPSLAAVTDVFQTDVLKRHRVNVYSEAATAFAAAAESRFRPAR